MSLVRPGPAPFLRVPLGNGPTKVFFVQLGRVYIQDRDSYILKF